MNHDYLSKILRCTVSLKNCCQNFLKISRIFSKVSSKKAFRRTNRGIRNILFGSEIVTFHLFVIIGLAGWLPTWLGAACLSIALIGFVAYAA